MPKEKAKSYYVAGPCAFICRGCVEMCIEIFSRDAEWRNQQIAKLTELRDGTPKSN
jgi:hypothetical protein